MDIGVRFEIDRADLGRLDALVSGLAEFDAGELVAEIVQLGEEQTKQRIRSGGPSPAGEAWVENLEGTPTLNRTGDNLLGSVASSASGATGEWGAAWGYAHIHQFGKTIRPLGKVPFNPQGAYGPWLVFKSRGKWVWAKKVEIPARPFVGVSSDDAAEIRELVTDFLGRLL